MSLKFYENVLETIVEWLIHCLIILTVNEGLFIFWKDFLLEAVFGVQFDARYLSSTGVFK